MSIKTCCYKGCENFSINNIPNGNFTLFQFPKDPERRQKWVEFGEIRQDWAISGLLMCSDHFDRKYLSINQRRTVLIGPAVPTPYVANTDSTNKTSGDQESSDPESGYVLYAEGEVNDNDFITQEEEQLDQFEAERDLSLNEAIEYEHETDTGPTITHRNVQSTLTPKCDTSVLKRKGVPFMIAKEKVQIMDTNPELANDSPEIAATSMTATTQCTQPKSSNDYPNTASETYAYELEFDDTDLIDSTQVSTFQIRSEEFVQMTMKFYLDEKMELLRKIRRYESFIRDIKEKTARFKID